MSKVSVIMSIYNETEDEIKKSVSSMVNQSYPYIEIIIVLDNPQRNEIPSIIEKLNKKNNILLVINEKNIGLAMSLNKAISLATGKYVARMDSDDISHPERVEKQLHYLLNHSNVDLVSTNYNLIDEEDELIRYGNEFNYDSDKLNRLLHIQNFLIHPSWLLRKETIVDLSGYRNFPSSQDYDFILRLLDRGGKIEILSETLLEYRVREKSVSNSRGLEQFLLSKYIKKLSKERKRTSQDSFTEGEMNRYISRGEVEKIKFERAKEALNHNRIAVCFYFVYYRPFRIYIYEKIKFKIAKLF